MRADLAGLPVFTGPFFFLRHGESESNLAEIIAGSIDVGLTARGRMQAEAAARLLGGQQISEIYSSALIRARETAEIVADHLALTVDVIPELAERCWGELEGKARALRVKGYLPPGAETMEVFEQRIVRGFSQIPTTGLPLVVSHSGVHRVLTRLLDLPHEDTAVDNALPLLFSLESGSKEWKVRALTMTAVRT